MKYLLPALVLVSSLAACGGPPDCSPDDRSGLYLASYKTVSGNCGDIPDVLVQAGAQSDASCTTYTSTYSEDDCRFDLDQSCDVGDGTRVRATGFSEQQDDDGEELKGKMTVTQTQIATSGVLCVGTYEVTYKRQ